MILIVFLIQFITSQTCSQLLTKFNFIPNVDWKTATQSDVDSWGSQNCDVEYCKNLSTTYTPTPMQVSAELIFRVMEHCQRIYKQLGIILVVQLM